MGQEERGRHAGLVLDMREALPNGGPVVQLMVVVNELEGPRVDVSHHQVALVPVALTQYEVVQRPQPYLQKHLDSVSRR